jgi:L-fucose mutarotase/ribose pyranase (RbsD/FucU family)
MSCRHLSRVILLSAVAIFQTCQQCSSFQLKNNIFHRRLDAIKGKDDNADWWKRNDDEEVINKVVEDAVLPSGYSLFDDAYTIKNLDGTADKYSVSELTLREISEAYQFSLSFLGDFVVQQGCQPPIDVDTKLSNILMAEQVYTLLEAITSLDPFDSNVEYDSFSVTELADDLDVPVGRILRVCRGEGFNLPYGLETMLHEAVVDRIREVYEFDDYIDDGADMRNDDDDDDDELKDEYDEYGDKIDHGGFNFDSTT